jgi:hypothetical protein
MVAAMALISEIGVPVHDIAVSHAAASQNITIIIEGKGNMSSSKKFPKS